MLTAEMFSGFTTTLTSELAVVVPPALTILATLWGLRLAISYFKGIAR